MLNRLLFNLSGRLPCRLIHRTPGDKYLERYYVGKLFGVTFYLHRFVSRDGDAEVHNHPWTWSRSLVLAGGYREEYVVDLCPHAGPSGAVTAYRDVRWSNRIVGAHFHRIAEVLPGTWTLFFHSQRATLPDGALKGWGFLNAEEHRTRFTPAAPSPGGWHHFAPLGRQSGREPLN